MKKFSGFDPIQYKKEIIKESVVEPIVEKTGIVKLFSMLFESRDVAHIYHLQVRGEEGSYAKHMALGTYYETIIPLIDNMIEVYQGQYDIIEGYQSHEIYEMKKQEDPVEYFTNLVNDVKTIGYSNIGNESHLIALLDDIVTLLYKTLYKLKFNK